MRQLACAAGLIAALAPLPATADTKTIDLRTAEGVRAIRGEWRFANANPMDGLAWSHSEKLTTGIHGAIRFG